MRYNGISDQYNKLKIIAIVTGIVAVTSSFFAFIFPKISGSNGTEKDYVLLYDSGTHTERESLSNGFIETIFDDVENTESSTSNETTTKFLGTTTTKIVYAAEKTTKPFSTKPYTTTRISKIPNTPNSTTIKVATTKVISSTTTLKQTTTQKATTVSSTEPTLAAPSMLRVVGFNAVASVEDDGVCRMYFSGTVTSNYKINTYVIVIHEAGCTLELEERCRNVYGTIKLPQNNAVIIKNAQKGDILNVTITASDSSGKEISVHDTVVVE